VGGNRLVPVSPPFNLGSEGQKLYDQDIEYIYIPLVTSPNSQEAEAMRGRYSLPHEAERIIEN
jgi:hypothetical protein